ncbi:efflux RND transporter periplasmic adaptor subunit [Comamonas serinivorans]|uniref:efflux RND transporter periplasmic adaptor subunit n=1 Tax=Comamonas serinivorans TaxID=1082851 RepID=UPI001F02E904|nr:efflux RND transporter periplasmic adaptor subunit [Comamonas serinivorans]
MRACPLAICSALVIALGLAACGDKAPSAATPKPPEVGVITLGESSQALSSELPGRTSAFMSAEVRPQVSGIVQKRLFNEGSTVKAGQVLYQIDPSTYRTTLASAKAALAKAQAAAHTARVNAERNAELVKIDAVSRQVAQESEAQAAQALSDVAAAQAAVEAAQINLNYTEVKAPISGRVNLSTVTPGALVTANQAAALTTIVQLDPMYVDFTQSTAELLALRRDIESGRYQGVSQSTLPVKLLLEDGSPYAHEGKLEFSGLIVDPGTGGVTLRAAMPNPDGMLMPGMYVRAQLPTGVQPKALLIPQQAVQRDPSGRANVWLLSAEDTLTRQPVTLSRAIGNQWLVEAGLKPGDRIVVDGFQRVRAGIQVKPVDAPATISPVNAASARAAAATPAAAASAASAESIASPSPSQQAVSSTPR